MTDELTEKKLESTQRLVDLIEVKARLTKLEGDLDRMGKRLDVASRELQETLLESLERGPLVPATLSVTTADGWKDEHVFVRSRPKHLAEGDYWAIESKRFQSRGETRILHKIGQAKPPMSAKQIEAILAPFKLKPLSRKGGLSGVMASVAAASKTICGRLDEEEARIEALVATRSNTVEDNRRWTTWAVQSIDAGRYIRAFLSGYLAWLGEEEPEAAR